MLCRLVVNKLSVGMFLVFVTNSCWHMPYLAKLAPIFNKKKDKESDSGSDDVQITLVDLEAVQRRKDFLLSGVPEKLLTIKSSQEDVVELSEYMPFPMISHVQQIPGTYESQKTYRDLDVPSSVSDVQKPNEKQMAGPEGEYTATGSTLDKESKVKEGKTLENESVVQKEDETKTDIDSEPVISEEKSVEENSDVQKEHCETKTDTSSEIGSQTESDGTVGHDKIVPSTVSMELLERMKDVYLYPHLFSCSSRKLCDPWNLACVNLNCTFIDTDPCSVHYSLGALSELNSKCAWHLRLPVRVSISLRGCDRF